MAEEVRRDQETPEPVNTGSEENFTGLTQKGTGAPNFGSNEAEAQNKPLRHPNEEGATEPEGSDAPREAYEQAPQHQGPVAAEEEPPRSKFLSNEDHMRLLKAWNLRCLPNELEDALDGGKIKRLGDDNYEFKLKDGSSFAWNKDKEGNEFIGVKGICKLTEMQAAAQVAAAVAHGWNELDVYGTQENKEKLWLASMRQGVTVLNFEPDPNSDVAKKWAREKDNLVMPTLAPAREHTFAPPPEEGAGAPQADAATPAGETPVAGEPSAGTLAAETPETPEQPVVAAEEDPKTKAAKELREAAASINDADHREGVEKLAKAVEEGKVDVSDPLNEMALQGAVKSRDGFNHTATYLNGERGLDLAPLSGNAGGPSAAPPSTGPANNGGNAVRKNTGPS